MSHHVSDFTVRKWLSRADKVEVNRPNIFGWFHLGPSALTANRLQRRETDLRTQGPHAIGQDPFRIVNNVRYDRPKK
jgi:hypothetical protein